VARAADGKLDDADEFAIMAVMFTPLTQKLLEHPATKDNNLRQLSGVEDLIHVTLVDPAGNPGPSHTLTYENDHWTVTPGLNGTPKRVFKLSPQEAREYQVRAFSASKANDVGSWSAFSSWYRDWRETVSTKTAAN
jgi:hypothetical protein